MTNRVSWVSVKTSLERFLTADMADKILRDMEYWDHREAETEVGMTWGDWKRRFDDNVTVVWAADTKGGFGHKGDTVYGDCDDCEIVKISEDIRGKTLYLLDADWGDWRD